MGVEDDNDNEILDPDSNCDAGGYVDDVHGWDFVNDDGSVYDDGSADETSGHATHVAGTIGAVGGNGVGVAGVNWAVSIISVKYTGSSTTFNLAKALDYLIDLKTNPDTGPEANRRRQRLVRRLLLLQVGARRDQPGGPGRTSCTWRRPATTAPTTTRTPATRAATPASSRSCSKPARCSRTAPATTT